jgi:hypothetical protein
MSIDALSAQELSVALAHGLVEHSRHKVIAEGDRPSQTSPIGRSRYPRELPKR